MRGKAKVTRGRGWWCNARFSKGNAMRSIDLRSKGEARQSKARAQRGKAKGRVLWRGVQQRHGKEIL